MSNEKDLSGKGTGIFHPADADEYAQITVTVARDGTVSEAVFMPCGDTTADKCSQTVCRLLRGFPARDVLQINNNAVYYNIDTPLPLGKLFCATIAVTAAKKAVIEYMKSIGEEIPEYGCCSCLSD